jgi:hypothetical protein
MVFSILPSAQPRGWAEFYLRAKQLGHAQSTQQVGLTASPAGGTAGLHCGRWDAVVST